MSMHSIQLQGTYIWAHVSIHKRLKRWLRICIQIFKT